MTAPNINVALVEDDSRLRRVVSEVLAGAPDCRCGGVYAAGRAALAALPGRPPHVLIMDINLPDIDGVSCVTQLAPLLPQTRILMLTVFQDTETIFRALAAGAHGYLIKPVMPDQLLAAVRDLHAGGVPMSPAIARKIIDAFLHPVRSPTPPPGPTDPALGPREQQVLHLIVQGLSQKEVATELNVSVSTVNTYVQRIYDKLHVRSRRGLMERYRPHRAP